MANYTILFSTGASHQINLSSDLESPFRQYLLHGTPKYAEVKLKSTNHNDTLIIDLTKVVAIYPIDGLVTD
jgi:hypothetical protein